MSSLKGFKFINVEWNNAANDILEIRNKVLVIEHHLLENDIHDQFDVKSKHLLVKDPSGKPVACGRLAPNGHIGKIAVLMDNRNKGIGTLLLSKLIKIAKKSKITILSLNSETALIDFYHQQKFNVEGPVYMKQGVPYQHMIKSLA